MNRTIKSFIDDKFSSIEETREIIEIKRDLLSSSLDKYDDLISNGYNKSEALDKIINEFGSLDEILSEINFSKNFNYNDDIFNIDLDNKKVSMDNYKSFYKTLKTSSRLISFATILIILLASIFISLILLKVLTSTFYIVLLSILGVIPSVVMYIIGGIKINLVNNSDLDKGLNNEADKYRKNELLNFNRSFTMKMVVSVIFLIGFFIIYMMLYSGVFETTDLLVTFICIAALLLSIGLNTMIVTNMKRKFLNKYRNIDDLNIYDEESKFRKGYDSDTKETNINKVIGIIFMVAIFLPSIISSTTNSYTLKFSLFPIALFIIIIIRIITNKKNK